MFPVRHVWARRGQPDMARAWAPHRWGTGSAATVSRMSEHDDNQDPIPAADPLDPAAVQPVEPPEPVAVAPAAIGAPVPPAPPAEPKTRWRDRVFQMRAVAAVAVAGVILGAAGGAVTTALVSDHKGEGHERPAIGQNFGPGGVPAVPPDGRQGFPGMPGQQGDSDDDQAVPDSSS